MAKSGQTTPGASGDLAEEEGLNRRGFLKGAAAGTAALVAKASTAQALEAEPVRQVAALPSEAQLARETTPPPVEVDPRITENPGSDFIVDCLRNMGIEYVTANPGSSFDGLQESIVNYGKNTMPEFLTCLHEESAVAMAHGWAKVEGRPTMMPLLHGTIGLQHAAMAVYNAYCDRVPVFMIAGLDYQGPIAAHNATDMAEMVRSYVKWDNQPSSLAQFATAALRAFRLASTPPMAPVLIVMEGEIQQQALPQNRPTVPRFVLPAPPSADIGVVREIAKMLVDAENPRIQAGRVARSPEGITLLVELAELLQAPVGGGGQRVNFPNRHPLSGNGSGQPDVILALEANAGAGGAGGNRPRTVSITSAEFLATSNYSVGGGLNQADLIIAADAQATLPALIEEVRRLITSDRRRTFEQRGARHAEANLKTRQEAMMAARFGWDDSPVSIPRLTAELWALLKNEDWSLVSPQGFLSQWPSRLWDMHQHYHYIGEQGGGGLGYGTSAAVGAALANKKHGRLSINIQSDGDLNYVPGVLWTAAHHRIPLLTIMHNNRGYHQEVMILQRQATRRNRGIDNAHIGTALRDPDIDYAKMAQSYGMYGEGPVATPDDLGPALQRGIERVKRGEPALIDVLTQPR